MSKDTHCPCGCGLNITDELVLIYGQIKSYVKQFANIDIEITSAARCPDYNAKVGGVKNSPHILGKAIDISIPDSKTRDAVLKAIFYYGIKRKGIGSNFIHMDIGFGKFADGSDSYEQNVTWLYA